MRRLSPLVLPLALMVLAASAASVAPAAAQLRPLPPADWHDAGHVATCGAGYYGDVGVGLLGERGTLRSLGDCTLGVDLGAVRLRTAGVVWRTFRSDTAYAEPFAQVRPADGATRSDWGDLLLETVVPVRSGPGWVAGFRFGVRVPISDNRIGLERDRTDLHMIAMGGFEGGRLAGHLELGVGINGTRVTWREQQDVLVYGVRGEYRLSPGLRVHLGALGHLKDRTERGNENQGEVRAGLRVGGATWLDAEGIAGYTEASPSWGVRLRVGRHFHR